MSRIAGKPHALSKSKARRLWLHAQRLDTVAPFGDGPDAVRRAVEHLGYVQIDTINVIERCHHHILHTRIPTYRRAHLHRAQSVDKTVFEYWTHALSYVPTRDIRVFVAAMKREWQRRSTWFTKVRPEDVHKVLSRIRRDGPLTIRDIDDDTLVEKDHAWASRKPSKRALQLAFYQGVVTVSERSGMLKAYELTDRHFGWERRPRPATEQQVVVYMVDRALRSQGLVSLDSICRMDAGRKPAVSRLIEAKVRRRELVPVAIEDAGAATHWAPPALLDTAFGPIGDTVHILSPFDPLISPRRRLQQFFDYEHRFEAYVPKERRALGYFALPVLLGDEVVAAIDLRTDRKEGRLQVQQWTWVGKGSRRSHGRPIEEALHRFEKFQLAS